MICRPTNKHLIGACDEFNSQIDESNDEKKQQINNQSARQPSRQAGS